MNEVSRPTEVVIVDDHNVMRSGLRMLIESEPDLTVVGEAGSGEEAIQALDELSAGGSPPDLVLMDLMMEGIGGLEATRRIRSDYPQIVVLVLTMADDRAYLREAFQAGASGYVLKDAADDELVEALRTVAAGGRYLHPSLGAELAQGGDLRPKTPYGIPLSEREVEVLRLIALGHTSREVGDKLFISTRTVETHKTHINQKTGLKTRAELVRFAIDMGLLVDQL
jgi:two-component system, NarL family, response regulator NreC